jgi:hypothetical protein
MKKTAVRNALKAQLARLKKDKESDAFKSAPLYFVVMLNQEISILEALLADPDWKIMKDFT